MMPDRLSKIGALAIAVHIARQRLLNADECRPFDRHTYDEAREAYMAATRNLTDAILALPEDAVVKKK